MPSKALHLTAIPLVLHSVRRALSLALSCVLRDSYVPAGSGYKPEPARGHLKYIRLQLVNLKHRFSGVSFLII